MLKTNTYRARKKNKIKVFNEEINNSLGNSWGKRMYHISFFCKKGKPEKKNLTFQEELALRISQVALEVKNPPANARDK